MARFFDGVDDRIDIGVGLTLPVNSPVSVFFWNHVATGDTGGGGSAFNIGALGDPSRCHAHAPFSDITLYWDYGTAVAGRVSTSYASYLDKWTAVGLTSEGNGGAFKAIYLDGTETSVASSDGPDVVLSGASIGAWTGFHKGSIAEFAVWDVRLTAEQFTELAGGLTPLAIQSDDLLAYWPLFGDLSPEPDFVGGLEGTVTGTTQTAHPDVRYILPAEGPFDPQLRGTAWF